MMRDQGAKVVCESHCFLPLVPLAVLQPSGRYTRAWRAHVWSHLPFYTILFPAFMELCYNHSALNAKTATNNVYRVSQRAMLAWQGMGARGVVLAWRAQDPAAAGVPPHYSAGLVLDVSPLNRYSIGCNLD